jgi:replication factor C large subunit
MTWVEKHKPKSFDDVIGQENLGKLRYAIVNKKPVLLSGITGIGKTSSVYALAKDMNYEVVEINASDVRNKEGINSVIGNAMKQQSLFYKGKIILIDEIDGLSGMKDRGGVQALSALLSNNVSVVMTTNDAYSDKIKPIKKKSELIEFNELKHFDILKVLQKILAIEKINYDKDILNEIAMNSGGDLRGAINDLQVLSAGKEILDKIEGISEREKKKVIFEVLKKVFKSENIFEVLGCLRDTNINLDEFFLWLDENLPKEFFGNDLVEAYEKLSRSDVFNGRIRNQRWRLLLYRDNLMTCGVNVSKSSVNPRFVGYKRSGRILKIWLNNMKSKHKKNIIEKSKSEMHVSKKKFEKEILPYMKVICRNGGSDFGLEREEVEWLKY